MDSGHRFGGLSCSMILRHTTGRMPMDSGRTSCLRCALQHAPSSFAISASVNGRLSGSPGFCFGGTQSYQMWMR